MIKSIEWTGNILKIVDQTQIPARLVYRELTTAEEVYQAIRELAVRGAPAIGIAAAYGLYLGLRQNRYPNGAALLETARQLSDYLSGARPTAVNLRWALDEILTRLEAQINDPAHMLTTVLQTAHRLRKDDEERCQKIGEFGAELIRDGMTVLTHCNTGALATAGIGTALGAIYTAHRQGKKIQVLVDETRPLLQGARLTMWELQQAGIPARLITDGMAPYAMQRGMVDLVIVGADRIALNGDVANKIGTYSLAVSSHRHGIPFYSAAPLSTFDFSISSGAEIPIEERTCAEVSRVLGKLPITVADADCWNPAFDVSPAELLSGIITEKGVLRPPFEQAIRTFKINQQNHQNNKELIL